MLKSYFSFNKEYSKSIFEMNAVNKKNKTEHMIDTYYFKESIFEDFLNYIKDVNESKLLNHVLEVFYQIDEDEVSIILVYDIKQIPIPNVESLSMKEKNVILNSIKEQLRLLHKNNLAKIDVQNMDYTKDGQMILNLQNITNSGTVDSFNKLKEIDIGLIGYYGLAELQIDVEKAARIIQKKYLNWFYKPICKDKSLGLHCKITKRELGLM